MKHLIAKIPLPSVKPPNKQTNIAILHTQARWDINNQKI